MDITGGCSPASDPPCGLSEDFDRRTDIFGQDAGVFNPDRWLGENAPSMKGFSNGVFANMCVSLSFAGEQTQKVTIQLPFTALLSSAAPDPVLDIASRSSDLSSFSITNGHLNTGL
jgi:hypothetical protein